MPSRTWWKSRIEDFTMMSSFTQNLRGAVRVVAMGTLAVCIVGVLGCAHINNPYKDSSAVIDDDLTTPSAEGHKGKTEFGRPYRRSWAQSEAASVNGAVTHWPLWFEDSFEDKGNGFSSADDRDAPDNAFCVNWVDYLHILYGPGCMALNAAAWPVSAIVTPPGTLMESDGHISKGILWYEHDATRSDSVNREPPDYNEIALLDEEQIEMSENEGG